MRRFELVAQADGVSITNEYDDFRTADTTAEWLAERMQLEGVSGFSRVTDRRDANREVCRYNSKRDDPRDTEQPPYRPLESSMLGIVASKMEALSESIHRRTADRWDGWYLDPESANRYVHHHAAALGEARALVGWDTLATYDTHVVFAEQCIDPKDLISIAEEATQVARILRAIEAEKCSC